MFDGFSITEVLSLPEACFVIVHDCWWTFSPFHAQQIKAKRHCIKEITADAFTTFTFGVLEKSKPIRGFSMSLKKEKKYRKWSVYVLKGIYIVQILRVCRLKSPLHEYFE